jgi:L-fuconolactonase
VGQWADGPSRVACYGPGMEADRIAWLARTVEEPVDAGIPICDPHHHLWDHPTDRYLLDELWADTGSGHNVTETVFVECMSGYRQDGPEPLRPVGETEFVADVADTSERGPGAVIAGIVSFADLGLGDAVRPVLEAHVEAGGGRFRGIRHATSWDPSPDIRNAHTAPPQGLMGTDPFRAGARVLADMGLTFDAWLFHPQITELAELAHAQPDLTMVLDHLGGPLGIGPYLGRRHEVLEWWRPAMQAAAACPNVNVKLGGIGMAIYGDGWHHRQEPPGSDDLVAAWGDPIRFCIDTFGPERCMFESNFPVDKRGCSYTVLWNAFQKIAEPYSDDEKALLFRGCALRAYRLGPG